MGFSISAGEIFGLSCSLVWAVNSLMVRTQSQAIPPAMMNGIRCAVATVFFWAMLPFGPPLSSYSLVTGTEWALLVGGLLIGMAVGETMYLAAIREIGVSRAMALSGTFPLSTFFFEWALLQNPFSRRFFLGICLVAVGVIFLSSRSRQPARERPDRLVLGTFLALFACLLWGLSTVMLKPAIANMTSVQANSVRVPLTAAVLFLARAWAGPVMRIRDIDRRALFIVAASGIVGVGGGSLLYVMAIARIGPAKMATLASVSPVLGMLMSVFLLKEKLTLPLLAGVILCVGGVWMVL